MPGPGHPPRREARRRGARRARCAESVLDDAVRRLLRLAHRTGALDARGAGSGTRGRPARAPRDRAARRGRGDRAAREPRRTALPLDAARLRRIAVIGPNAEHSVVQGGGSARVRPHYVGVGAGRHSRARRRATSGSTSSPAARVTRPRPRSARACSTGRCASSTGTARRPTASPRSCASRATPTSPGSARSRPRSTRRRSRVRLRGRITPRESGAYTFSLVSAGKSRLFVDGVERRRQLDRSAGPGEAFFGLGSAEVRADVALEAGRTRGARGRVLERGPADARRAQGRLPAARSRPICSSARCAARRGADAAIVVVGLNDEWETRGPRPRRPRAARPPGRADRARRRRQPAHDRGRERGRADPHGLARARSRRGAALVSAARRPGMRSPTCCSAT